MHKASTRCGRFVLGKALHVALHWVRRVGPLRDGLHRIRRSVAYRVFGDGFVEDFGAVVEIPEPWLVGAEGRVFAASDGFDECPDHVHERVVVGEHFSDALASRVGHLNAALSDLGDDALHDLNLDCAVAVDSAVFVRSLAAGW